MILTKRHSQNNEQSDEEFYFKPLIAPLDYTDPSQNAEFGIEVNVVEIFKRIKKTHKKAKYIYAWAGATEGNTAAFNFVAISGVKIIWGEQVNGVEYESDEIESSQTVFTVGSTHRWIVIIQESTIATNMPKSTYVPTMVYYGNEVTEIVGVSGAQNKFTYSRSFKGAFYSGSINKIGDYSFFCCRLTVGHITIPAGCTYIGNYAFYYGENYTGPLIIPEGITYIGTYAFQSCKFTSLSLPSTVNRLGAYCFQGCKFTGHLNIPDNFTVIDEGAFALTKFTSITIPDGITSIKNNALYGIPISSLFVPSSVRTIGDKAFMDTTSLIEATISEGVETIGEAAFYSSLLTNGINLPSTLKSIGGHAFKFSSLIQITIPEGVTTLGSNVFYGCTSLQYLSIPSTITSMGTEIIGNCTNLTRIDSYLTDLSWSPNNPLGAYLNSTNFLVEFHIPVGTLAIYQAKWSLFKNYIEDL